MVFIYRWSLEQVWLYKWVTVGLRSNPVVSIAFKKWPPMTDIHMDGVTLSEPIMLRYPVNLDWVTLSVDVTLSGIVTISGVTGPNAAQFVEKYFCRRSSIPNPVLSISNFVISFRPFVILSNTESPKNMYIRIPVPPNWRRNIVAVISVAIFWFQPRAWPIDA